MPILYVSLQSRSPFPPDFRWTDPHTWPWMIWVWAGFIILGWLAPLWRWFQRDRVTSWLSAIGVVESIREPEPRTFLGMALSQNSSQGVLEIRYSYSPLGQSYRGRHKIDRASKFNLDEFTNRLIGLPIQVQYHPDKPAVSALMDSSIEALLRQAPPLSREEEQLIRAAHEIPAVYLPWLLPLMYLALAGFLISFCINIVSLLGIVLPQGAPFFLLHVGIFVVFFPAILAAKKMVGYTNGRYFWKRLMNEAPEGFRYLFYVVFGYCWLIGFLSFSQPFPGKDPSSFLSTRSEWLPFSAVWMVFYYSSFVILLSARNYSLKSSSHY
jgi:hypothetical protein